jgi:signal transduction histidine kinase
MDLGPSPSLDGRCKIVLVAGHLRQSSAHRSVRAAVVVLSLAFLLFAVVEAIVLVDNPISPRWALLLFPEVAMAYVLAGAVMWIRRPHNRMGAVAMSGGFAFLSAGIVNAIDVPALIAIGHILTTTPFLACVYVLMAFPSGRIDGRADRVILASAAFVVLILQIPLYTFGPWPPPFDVLVITPKPEWMNEIVNTQRVVGGAVMIAVATTLALRFRSATRAQRLVLGPVYVIGILAVLMIPAHRIVEDLFGLTPLQTAVTAFVALALVPLAFAVCLFRGGFSKTTEVAELGAWLGAVEVERPEIRIALADTLGDPMLDLVFWSTAGGFIDAAGHSVDLVEGPHRAIAEIELEGRRLGAIVYDPTMIRDRGLVTEAGRVVALALDREQLHANLRASEEAVRESRRRLVGAGDEQRRRLAQDLHDGLQSKLVLLAIQAGRHGDDDLRHGIELSIDDLRALVHGVMPPVLLERGLYAATEDLVDRLPLPTRLNLPVRRDRLDPTVEHAAYLVVSEAVTNALKHSMATELEVRVDPGPEFLTIEIGDDGIGGASMAGGSGLRGLADRVDTLGGRFRVDSPSGLGTRVSVVVPCAS